MCIWDLRKVRPETMRFLPDLHLAAFSSEVYVVIRIDQTDQLLRALMYNGQLRTTDDDHR